MIRLTAEKSFIPTRIKEIRPSQQSQLTIRPEQTYLSQSAWSVGKSTSNSQWDYLNLLAIFIPFELSANKISFSLRFGTSLGIGSWKLKQILASDKRLQIQLGAI